MITLLALSAFGADVERYPLRAEVALPAQGVARVRVPVGMRSVPDPVDGSDLLLVDAAGREVPVVRLEGDPGTREPVRVTVSATLDPDVYGVDLGPLPVDQLSVTLPPGVPAATIRVATPAGERLAGPFVLFDLPGGRRLEVDLPARSGPVRVELVPTRGFRGERPPSFQGWRRRTPPVPPDRIEVAVGAPWIQENGFVRYEAGLERPLPIDRVTVVASDRIYERQAEVVALPWNLSPSGWMAAELWAKGGTIQRVVYGDVSAEAATLPGPRDPTDRLALVVSAHGQPPLDVSGLVVELDGVELLVLDAGPGPHVLYAGAPPGTSPAWDLDVAGPELARRATTALQPGPVEPNPAWVAPEVRANLAGPGPELESDRWRWRREVAGSGLVRIPLPPEVLSSARPDLGDLRLERDGRQFPYVLRRDGVDPRVEDTTFERSERGGRSVLRVRLPEEGLPVSMVTLRTEAAVFQRQVTVSRVRGTALEPLRTVSWVGRDRPMALTIEVGSPIDDELVVEIDNGDDPPLPITEVTLRAAGWELLAILPESGATLLYGAPAVGPPSYDLGLLSSELVARASSEATVGEPAPVARPALGALDRVLLAVGIGVLALGLLGLAADLLRRLPPEPSAPA